VLASCKKWNKVPLKNSCAYHIIVKGRVQGVGYRAFAAKTAQRFGVFGFVKNKSDGTVEIVVQGQKEAVDKFVSMCKVGPGWGRVDQVELTESLVQDYSGFRIKY